MTRSQAAAARLSTSENAKGEAATVVQATDIAAWLDAELDAEKYRADEPENGLLVDAGRPVLRIATAVNTTFETISEASAAGADLLMVHHPSWPYIDLGLHQRKLDALMAAGISLYAAHASLDVAADGTGQALARLIDLSTDGRFADYHGGQAGVHGRFGGGWDALVEVVGQRLGVPPEVHRNADRCERVGIVTGGGGLTSWLDEARAEGCDTYLTGEGSMYTRLFAREMGINLILAGHVATEAPGIHALGRRTASQFQLPGVALPEAHIG
jgi:dinuclear metal center YbgI/SA1388 family protein